MSTKLFLCSCCIGTLALTIQGSLRLLPDEQDIGITVSSFKDCPECPEMINLSGGSFMMGSKEGVAEPVHPVKVSAFAIGKYEITFDEYDAFAKATGRELPDDLEWGRGRRSVINVSWKDANFYTQWLSEKTSKTYRLPTEAEWEYAARGGTTTKYWWGDDYRDNAKCWGCASSCIRENIRRVDYRDKTAIVGSYRPNPFGLYDTAGNVWEWTCSEYTNRYDGHELLCARNSERRAIRGGPIEMAIQGCHSAGRGGVPLQGSGCNLGFRVALVPTEGTSPSNLNYANILQEQAEVVIQEQLKKLYDVANGTQSSDEHNTKNFVLSTEVLSFQDIPAEVDQKIQIVRKNIQALFLKVATDIERRVNGGTASIPGNDDEKLPRDAAEAYRHFMMAKQKNNVSMRSAQLAVQILLNLSKQWINNTQREEDAERKRKLYIMQLALIYELSDIVYNFLDKVSLEGKVVLEGLSAEHQERIQSHISDIEKLIARTRQGEEPGTIQSDGRERLYRSMQKADEQVLQVWKAVMQQVSQQDKALKNIQLKRENIRQLRDKAKLQLDILRNDRVINKFRRVVNAFRLMSEIEYLLTANTEVELLEFKPESVKTLFF